MSNFFSQVKAIPYKIEKQCHTFFLLKSTFKQVLKGWIHFFIFVTKVILGRCPSQLQDFILIWALANSSLDFNKNFHLNSRMWILHQGVLRQEGEGRGSFVSSLIILASQTYLALMYYEMLTAFLVHILLFDNPFCILSTLSTAKGF